MIFLFLLISSSCYMVVLLFFIFERDGTIIKDMHYLSNPNDVELLPKAKTTLHKLKDLGHDLHIHTNQSGVQRGYFTEKDIESCMQKMFELLGVSKNFFTSICISTDIDLSNPETYRKPSIKFAPFSIAFLILFFILPYLLTPKKSSCYKRVEKLFLLDTPMPPVEAIQQVFYLVIAILKEISINKGLINRTSLVKSFIIIKFQ